MEFSFDRSKDAHLRRPEPSATPNNPNSSGVRAGPDLNSQDPSSIANERLRKAIERNRAKQAEREAQAQAAKPQAEQTFHEQASFFNRAEEVRREEPKPSPPPEPPKATVVSRRSVAKPDDTEFVPAKRATRKVSSQISYSTSSARKKSKSYDPKLISYLVKGCWIFCGIMVLRLIFANGGVTDFYSQKSQVNTRLAELSQIKKENMQLVREIERMRSDAGFQKKLVRDNLGFIASDEFLVLFPKEKEN